MRTAFVILFVAFTTALAQTNFVPRIEADGQVYSNIYILRTTPSYAVVQFDGGAAQIALSNFPPEIQQQYHYDPEKAREAEIADAARREEAAKAEAARNAALLQQQSWRGRPVAATIQSIQGTLSVWTKCQISVSNKTEVVLLGNVPAAVQQYFDARNLQSNQLAAASQSINAESQRLAQEKANLPKRRRANSTAGREQRQINADEKALTEKRAELTKQEDSSRKAMTEAEKATHVTVRQTGQTYASLQVWECVK